MNQATKTWTAALIVIGDEILSGRTQDKNVAQVATWLNDQGIRLAEVRVIPDDMERIAETVNALRAAHDYVFTTGGIGPTHDDITVDAVAAAFEVPVSLAQDGRVLRGTIDCLIRRPDGALVVIEVKTGPPRPEHQRQLAAYLGAIQALGPGIRATGCLVHP